MVILDMIKSLLYLATDNFAISNIF